MTNTPKPLTTFEVDTLRFLREVELDTDPCVPVPHSHFLQLRRCLVRRGLALPDGYRGRELTDEGHALVASLPRLLDHSGCYRACSRTR